MGAISGRAVRRAAAIVVACLAAATACAPPDDGTPATPGWTTTRFPFTQSATERVSRIGAWTSENAFAYLEWTVPTGGSGSAELVIHPRTGPDGNDLGAPQRIPAEVSIDGLKGERFIGVGRSIPTGETEVTLYRPESGTWGADGTVTIPTFYEFAALTDDWLIARRQLGAPGGLTGSILVYPLDSTGSSIQAGAPVTIEPDAGWSLELQQGFGRRVAADGDLLAVSTSPYGVDGPGFVSIFEQSGGTWTPAQTLTSPLGANLFGNYLAIDDGATVDRLALAPQGNSMATLGVDVYADDGDGFELEQSIPRSSDPDLQNGLLLGYSIAIDDDLLVFTTRSTEVASSEPAHAPVKVGHVAVHRLGTSGWEPEDELRFGDDPYDADVVQALPWKVDVASGQVAVSLLVTGDPPPGCGAFGCINLGFEALSLSRR